MARDNVQGVRVEGRDPKVLQLSDGSNLVLDEEAGSSGRADWTLRENDGSERKGVSVNEALELAGADHANYVEVRTRAEIAWLHLISEWCQDQAERLDRELAVAARA